MMTATRPAMTVPPWNMRERIPQEAIDDVVGQIATQFDPQQIILFGSYAYGHPRPESDVDLLVVMDSPLRQTAQAVQICQDIQYNFGLDLIVRTPATLAQRLEWGDFFLREITQKGKVLYESTNGRMDWLLPSSRKAGESLTQKKEALTMRATRPAMTVPPWNMRERIPQEAIDDVVGQIATQFDPQQIILFGSYAYGHPRPESDVDLLVVMDTPIKEGKQSLQIRQTIDFNFALDIVVRTPATLAQRLEWGDFFLREITQKGKVLYESTNGRMG